MIRHAEVVCVGAATIDTIVVVDRLPGSDERVVADSFVTAGGGPAATAAVALARLGVPVAFCGVVGDDEAGCLVRASLESEGVDVERLRVDASAQTARSVILVERSTGARTIVTMTAAAPVPEDVPAGSGWLHADQTGYRAARAVSADGSRLLSIDAGNRIDGLQVRGLDLYAPTVSSLAELFPGSVDAGLRSARDAGAGTVIATAGADGAYVLDGDEAVHVPAFPVEAVSTLGAGDVFHGALLAALVGGSRPVEAARFAGAAAALSCRGVDGRSAIPRADEVEEFLAGAMPDSVTL